jgi:phage-related baseplate assembly protein
MSRFSTINLDELPFPDALDVLDTETTLQEQKDLIISLLPELESVLAIESEPATKMLELLSYQITVLRQRINNAVKATMLATATGSDLDHRAADYSVKRLVIDAGDSDSIPPREPVFESDTDLRRRTQLALEGLSTAGPEGAYIFHALSAHPNIVDASAASPSEGRVDVYILSRENNGLVTSDEIAAVNNHLTDDEIKPLTDQLQVQAANIINYQTEATLYFEEGPDKNIVKDYALLKLEEYQVQRQLLGRDITISGIYAALHVSGVQRVVLTSPSADLIIDRASAAYCTEIILNDGGYADD